MFSKTRQSSYAILVSEESHETQIIKLFKKPSPLIKDQCNNFTAMDNLKVR